MTAYETAVALQAISTCTRCVPSRDGTMGMEVENMGQGVEVVAIVPPPTNGQVCMANGGRLLRAYINRIYSPGQVGFLPVAGCGGSTAMCRSHLEQQLHSLSGLKLVLLIGKDGIDAWRPDQTLTKRAGCVGAMLDKWWCLPITNPLTVIQGYATKPQLEQELMTGKAYLDGELELDGLRMWDCGARTCKGEAESEEFFDKDGVGYCRKHWGKQGGQWKKVRKMWVQEKIEGTQPRLSL